MILILLKSKPMSQIELVAITDKSNPSVSRGLKLLMNKKIVRTKLSCTFQYILYYKQIINHINFDKNKSY